jgi:hypothetical protein
VWFSNCKGKELEETLLDETSQQVSEIGKAE